MSKAQKIRQLLDQGKSIAEISGKLKVSRQYIYAVKSSKMAKERRQQKAKFEPVGMVEIARVGFFDKIRNFWRALWK
jgi:hypothetical protein